MFKLMGKKIITILMPGPVAQSVSILIADTRIVTFVEINHEIFYMAILLLLLVQEGLLSVTSQSMCKE